MITYLLNPAKVKSQNGCLMNERAANTLPAASRSHTIFVPHLLHQKEGATLAGVGRDSDAAYRPWVTVRDVARTYPVPAHLHQKEVGVMPAQPHQKEVGASVMPAHLHQKEVETSLPARTGGADALPRRVAGAQLE
jgi:hypothetical protein